MGAPIVVSQRWLIAAALFAVVFSASSPIAAFGVFLPALSDAFGWSRGAISVALSLTLLLGGIGAFVVGAIADRHGPRGILAFTVAMAGAGFALASTTRTLWQLYLFVGLMGGIGTSGFYVIASSTVTRWFERQRGLALALVLAGFNVSFVTAGPVAAALIELFGWRGAFLFFGGWLCVVGGIAALIVRDPPRDASPHATPQHGAPLHSAPSHSASPHGAPLHGAGRDTRGAAPSHDSPQATRGGVAPTPRPHRTTALTALADRRLWLLALCWFLLGGVVLTISVHIVPHSRDRGVALATASFALTAYGIGATIGRLGFGALADRLGARTVMRICIVLQMVALIALVLGPPQELLLVVLAMFGMGFSGGDTAFVRIIPDVFGLEALGAITGLLTLGWRAGASLGPAVAGFVHDATGSYAVPFGLAPIALAVSFALFSWGSASRRSTSSV